MLFFVVWTPVFFKFWRSPCGNNLAELPWDEYLEDLKKKDIKNESANVKSRKLQLVFEKIPPDYATFLQHVKCVLLQSKIFN